MNSALIGYSGYVGTTLLKQVKFDSLYRSINIGDIENKSFDIVVCAGAPAQKWIANQDPEGDQAKIDRLISHLKAVRCKNFVLISTVDVFKHPVGVDEASPVEDDGLHAYGRNRLRLEQFVAKHFEQSLIVRLPGLVGPGLRKNVIFDFLNDNNIGAIDSRGVFQFYPMVNLWYDIETALAKKLQLVHLTAEPISVSKLSEQGFGRPFSQTTSVVPAQYDMRTLHASAFGGFGSYHYDLRATLQAVRTYAQSEPLTRKAPESSQ